MSEPLDPIEAHLNLDGHRGPAPRISASRRASLIDGALDQWQALPAPKPATPKPTPVPWMRVAAVSAAIGGLICGGGVALAMWLASPPAASAPPAPAPASSNPATPEPAPAPSPADEAPIAEPVASPAATVPSPAAPASPTPEIAPARAADLLLEGNRLRSQRRWDDAIRAYQSASRNHPRSTTAHVANVAAAELELEQRGRPAVAARLYRRALRARPRGPVAAEARVGIARAYRASGDETREREALRAVARHHGGSPAGTWARARLRDLDEP